MTAALLLAFGMAAPARLLEVRSENVEGRPAVVVVASSFFAHAAAPTASARASSWTRVLRVSKRMVLILRRSKGG